MRKWITALLIVTMVLTAGCGQKGTDQGAAGGADQGLSLIHIYEGDFEDP